MVILGADVTLIDQRPTVLEFLNRQIVESIFLPLAPAWGYISVGGKGDTCRNRTSARSCCCRAGERQENPSRRARLCRGPPSQWRPDWPGCCRADGGLAR